MSSAIRNSLKSIFTDPESQQNLTCHEVKHPTSLVKIVIHTMLTGRVVYQIMLTQCPMSDVRTIHGSTDVTPKG